MKAITLLGISTASTWFFGILAEITGGPLYYVAFLISSVCLGLNAVSVGSYLFKEREDNNADKGE